MFCFSFIYMFKYTMYVHLIWQWFTDNSFSYLRLIQKTLYKDDIMWTCLTNSEEIVVIINLHSLKTVTCITPGISLTYQMHCHIPNTVILYCSTFYNETYFCLNHIHAIFSHHLNILHDIYKTGFLTMFVQGVNCYESSGSANTSTEYLN
jgi:hypothetical protein